MASIISSSAFLDKLPPEMRCIIYRFALIDEADGARVSLGPSLEPGLLRVCKTIRKEAGPIFFGENSFGIDMTDGCYPALFWSRKVASVRKEFKIETRSFISCVPPGDMQGLYEWCEEYHTEPMYVSLDAPEIEGNPDRCDHCDGSIVVPMEGIRDCCDHCDNEEKSIVADINNEEKSIVADMLATAKAMAPHPWVLLESKLESFDEELYDLDTGWHFSQREAVEPWKWVDRRLEGLREELRSSNE